MIIGIDGSNIRAGGGITHLVALLSAAQPADDGFTQIVVWGGKGLLGKLPGEPWLTKIHCAELDRGLWTRLRWQAWELSRMAAIHSCNILFIPGGSYIGK